jgi:rhodanese-related sulfurtransferase
MEDLASKLYHSLHGKIMTLPDDLLVYPAHGAGSACGKNMSKETFDTLGNQKKVNYALQNIPESQFIKEVTEGLLPPPFYFPENVALNKKGAKSIDTVMKTGLIPLSPNEFEKIANAELALIIDTRHNDDFEKGFIPNSIFIGIKGDFAPWVGTLVTDIKQPILIIADIGAEKEVITRLARVGYDYTLGYLDGGFKSWKKAGKEIDTIKSIDASDLSNLLGTNDHILDVRKEAEFNIEHVKVAQNIPLANISEFMEDVSHENTNFVHCAGGYRSMVATSILKARGIDNVVNVKGGFGAIKEHSDLAII